MQSLNDTRTAQWDHKSENDPSPQPFPDRRGEGESVTISSLFAALRVVRFVESYTRYMAVLGLLLICSCATPYRRSKGGTGYSSARVSTNEFTISFRGNADTSLERADDFALLRSAEVTLENGFAFFSVIDITNTSSAKRYTRVYTGYASTPVVGAQDFGRYDYIAAPPLVQVQEPQIYFLPGITFFIRCFVTPPSRRFAYDAAALEESLKRKYKLR